ncbi:hypothetical protein Acid345_2518 [Candidatus Koribacter versatilis Ellin345]|uniref:Uncharacterized protein n=1 Tax=Koribacter versatilis (strain Ellin345) TaxID=204669 RepID=Q1INN1_KORVE|nr:hypothetical protein [Candidatus Koribacter versatilis]ABF41519.1 hypothetical protein Acid345_2518 [Candidatus Koribacter versatilis Ellin345]
MNFRKAGLLLAVLLLSTLGLAQTTAQSQPPTQSQRFLVPVTEYQPITGKQRLQWFADATVGPESLLLAGPWTAGWNTIFNSPKEYGPHIEGFGKRYGMRLTGVSTGNAMTATFGSFWGEDPRYFKSPHPGFKKRAGWVIVSPFIAPHRDGTWHPAYAYYMGTVGNNFLSNTWRAESESHASDAAIRCMTGVLGSMASNAFAEFWPDVSHAIFKTKKK